MARPKTDGLLYFPFDVDFFSDTKIKSIKAHYGTDGIVLYAYLLCEIYRNGYYVKADDDFIDCAAADLGFTADKTRQIISYLCRRSLFDNTLFTLVDVLTAKSIQHRYQEVRKGAKRDICVDEKLWLLEKEITSGLIKVRPFSNSSEKNPCFSEKNPCFSEKNDTKLKESKVKESKAKQAPPEAAENSICSPTKKACVRAVSKADLIAEYGEDNVTAYEKRFEHWKQKEGSVAVEEYATIAKWLKSDGVTKPTPSTNSSINVDEVWENIISRYNTAT